MVCFRYISLNTLHKGDEEDDDDDDDNNNNNIVVIVFNRRNMNTCTTDKLNICSVKCPK
jgi:hypothetical protein